MRMLSRSLILAGFSLGVVGGIAYAAPPTGTPPAAASKGMATAGSHASPGGESLSNTIGSDAGRGNSFENPAFFDDPGNSDSHNQGGG